MGYWCRPVGLKPVADEGMIRVTLSAVQAPSDAYGVEFLPPGQDQVQLVPVLRSGVASGDLVLDLVLKECVGDGQLVERAQLKESLTILVHLANTVLSEGGRPWSLLCMLLIQVYHGSSPSRRQKRSALERRRI